MEGETSERRDQGVKTKYHSNESYLLEYMQEQRLKRDNIPHLIPLLWVRFILLLVLYSKLLPMNTFISLRDNY